ncbi:Ankyrin repeat and zinc finger domain-containing protein 1 [Oryzias melastigma]|uniref:tRNA endonuclease ANKZF1 n=1 Tax=Oryzias melastigma TaxID=30732 RepID=A0A834CFV4_ORYME|nr:Ankyrin repeat and zinc finger domain-containing protein 1 [Oryzias melastigma]
MLQREHYKLDWHRFNLRQKIAGLPPLNAEEFEKKTGAGDLSSISGSESDSEDEGSDSKDGVISDFPGTDHESSVLSHSITGRLASKVVLQNSAGEYLSVYRCVLQGKIEDENDAVSSLRMINKGTVWVILMTGGGHFAGAVFEGQKVLQHKTFHRYTVRAKRGTAQGLRDSQNRSHAPKSAGAALRRYNEAALVKNLLLTWAEHINKASAIFVRVPSYIRSIFFGGRAAPLDKKDPRIRTLPFATRRATFREVQRVHEMLSTVHVYGRDTDITVVLSPSKKTWKSKVKSTVEEKTDQKNEEETNVSDEEEEAEIHLEMVELTLGTLDLRESEVYPSRHKRRRKKKLKQETTNQNKVTDDQEERLSEAARAEENPNEKENLKDGQKKKQLDDVAESLEYGLKDALFTACKVGDVTALGRLLQSPEGRTESFEELRGEASTIPSPLSLLNKPVDSSGFTLLHVAAAAAQKEAVRLLLDSGADPACRDNRGQTPYIVSPDKDTRNVFRKYMGENPDKYDYRKAQVPGPLTAETESKKAEKKKAQKAQKKQREKEQKEVRKKQEQEEEEKRKFASLTDREKRALAAERRLAEQAAAAGGGISNVK